MRVLSVVHQYPPERVGGTELYTQAVARGLARRGHTVGVFCRRSAPGAGVAQWLDEGVRVWAVHSGVVSPVRRFIASFGDPSLESAFARILDDTQPECIHIQHLMGLPLAVAREIRRRHIPFVITLWDYWWVCANAQLLTNFGQQVCNGPDLFLNCARCALSRSGHTWLAPALPPLAALLAYRNRLLRDVAGAAHRLLAPTEFVRQWYADHGALGDRIVVVPPALEDPPDLARQQAPGKLRVGYIGGLSWQKGVHVLVEALANIEGRAELWIAGDESADAAYAGRLRALATPDVTFLGRLDRAQVWRMLSQLDIVAVPTLWYETFSFIISEAFGVGLPVMASKLGPLADRVRDGVDGFLLPPGNVSAWRAALWRLVDEPRLLERLRAQVLPPPTLEDHILRLESIYGLRDPDC